MRADLIAISVPAANARSLARCACKSARMAAWADKDQRRRNAELLARLPTRARSTLLAQARKHAPLPDDAEEALQSAYALLIERYRERYAALPWLQTTVKREAWRIAKRAHRHREIAITAAPRGDGQGTADLTDAFPDPDADCFERACRDQFTEERRAAFEHLKSDHRLALLLLGLGYSYAEIAESCGWTMTKVNRCLSKGRAALREIMAEADRMSTSTQQPGKSRLDSKPETTVQGGTR